MEDSFVKKLRAARNAGWWTLLIALVIQLVQWFAWLAIFQAKPESMTALVGSGITWEQMQVFALAYMTAYKLFIWLSFLVVIWMTLWLKRLQ